MPSWSSLPQPRLDHLRRLTGRHGLFEHARHDRPRFDHGYTTDDNARALVVLSRLADPPTDLEPYLGFVIEGRTPGGWHNRMSADGHWTDQHGPDDSHGRALWGLAHVLAIPAFQPLARGPFLAGLDLVSSHSRANSYAALAASRALQVDPSLGAVEAYLRRIASGLPRARSGGWPWPEPRLSYANARLPEALMATGDALGERGMVDDGLLLLDWLVHTEMGDAGFSFTPVGGRGPGEGGPAFDQQPIEAWAMADACLRAFAIDPDPTWLHRAGLAALWFLGRNDSAAVLYDQATGAGFDGLERDGVNLNRGAESTLAALGTLSVTGQALRAGAG